MAYDGICDTYITLRYVTFHYVTLHCVTWRYFTLHCVTLHYACINININIEIHIHICSYFCLYFILHYIQTQIDGDIIFSSGNVKQQTRKSTCSASSWPARRWMPKTSVHERKEVGRWLEWFRPSFWPWIATTNSFTAMRKAWWEVCPSVSRSIPSWQAQPRSLRPAPLSCLWFCTFRWPLCQMNFWETGWAISLGPWKFPTVASFWAWVHGPWISCGKEWYTMGPSGSPSPS